MLVSIPDVLSLQDIAQIRQALDGGEWMDGRATAGGQAAVVKNNLQAPADSPVVQKLAQTVLQSLARSARFTTAALPLQLTPPMFNRYDVGMTFGAHVDGAIRSLPGTGARLRADVSATLFLTPPEDYDGGELRIRDAYGEHMVKLPAGHLVVYPSTSMHSVTPVTRGSRWAAVFWTQSMVKDDWRRSMLYDLDMAIVSIRGRLPDDDPAVVGLMAHYHNLLRAWCEV